MSAKTGTGMGAWLALLERRRAAARADQGGGVVRIAILETSAAVTNGPGELRNKLKTRKKTKQMKKSP